MCISADDDSKESKIEVLYNDSLYRTWIYELDLSVVQGVSDPIARERSRYRSDMSYSVTTEGAKKLNEWVSLYLVSGWTGFLESMLDSRPCFLRPEHRDEKTSLTRSSPKEACGAWPPARVFDRDNQFSELAQENIANSFVSFDQKTPLILRNEHFIGFIKILWIHWVSSLHEKLKLPAQKIDLKLCQSNFLCRRAQTPLHGKVWMMYQDVVTSVTTLPEGSTGRVLSLTV